MKPTISCTNRSFKYVPSFATDIRKTFSRFRSAARAKAQQEALRAAAASVFPGHCGEAVR